MNAVVVIAVLVLVAWIVWRASRSREVRSHSITPRPAPPPLARAVPKLAPPAAMANPPRPAARVVQEAPRTTVKPCWIPQGRTVTIAGLEIPGGMIYLGSGLRSVSEFGSIEPALIDPSLPVDRRNPDRSCSQMPYWPSYSTIPPSSRAAYLEWLAGGRQDPDVGIGHVFLFFYGLERRALFDAQTDLAAAAEIPAITSEVERLLGLYGSQGSFRGYAGAFLGILHGVGAGTRVDPTPPDVTLSAGYEVPLELRLGLGLLALEAKPLPADWALAWFRSAPTSRLRTPAQRCPEEFVALFRARYQQRYGDGLTVKPPKATIDVSYRPASASFAGTVRLKFSDPKLAAGVPDITSLQGPLNKITEVAESCVTDLEPFSRWVGRNPSLRSSPAAVALLPPELVASHTSEAVADLWTSIDERLEGESIVEMPGSELLDRWRKPAGAKLTRPDLVLLAQLLEKRGLGIEPDVRFRGPQLAADRPCVVFRLPAGSPSAPSTAYAAATLTLQLAVTVAAVDDDLSRSEVELLEGHLERALQVTAGERARLAAHLRWLLTDRPAATGLKKRLATLEASQRETVATFLVSVAAADGHITPAEVEAVTKLYRSLDLDPQRVYSELHAAAVSAQPPGAEPITVRPRAPSSPGFAIPAPSTTPATSSVTLDMARVQQKLGQTAAVSSLLQSIFVEDEELPPASAEPIPAEPSIAGLDGPHSAFLRAIAAKASWTRAEVEQLAAEHRVLPDGALDAVNEAALNLCGDTLLEGEDPIQINPDTLKDLPL